MSMPKAAAPWVNRVWASTGIPTISGPMSSRFTPAIRPSIQRKTGRATVKRRPAATAASGWSPSPAASAGSACMRASMAAETANESASTANATPTPVRLPAVAPATWLAPNSAMTTPASAGPTKLMSWSAPIMSALPASSCLFSSRRGSEASAAGMKNPETTPKPTASAYTIHSCTEPVRIETARAAAMTNRSASETSMMTRGECRSANAPPMSMTAARGIPASASTRPSWNGSWVSVSTSHGRAMRWNWSPRWETVWPIQSRR